MNPVLLGVAGPHRGNKITLDQEEVVIGRDKTNRVHISDLLLSRKHCSLLRRAHTYAIRDLNSRNGVFVNGIPIQERALQHGDRIDIGSSIFVFLLEDEQDVADPDQFSDSIQPASAITLKIDDSFYLNSSEREHADQASDLLIRVSRELSAAQTLHAFYRKLVDLMLDLLPADRVAILKGNAGERITARSRNDSKSGQFSRSVCEQAIEKKLAVLTSDFSLPGSLTGSEVRSILCVPFLWAERVLCLLYLDCFGSRAPLDQSHLQIATAVASLTSPQLHLLQETGRLLEENDELVRKVYGERIIIGESPAVQRIIQLITRIAPADTTVLILGESGTGKELAARAIHGASPRKSAPFVAINCAALPETLLESELFGYEKGAFTGALNQKKGRIESAQNGTLFLDEIAELAPALQSKLLRVLQEREFERVGSVKPIRVDVRVIAATNQDLQKSMQEGKFRKDLYYRLNVVRLEMPPLRELGDDILLLAQYFVSHFSRKLGQKVHGISAEAKAVLLRYDWPGNVRELQNAMEHAVLLGSTDWILPESLPEHLLERQPETSKQQPLSFHEALYHAKRELVLKAFEGLNGNYSEAAARLGLHPNHLYRLVKNLNLKGRI